MMAQLLADWTLIGLVVLAVGLFAAAVCGITGRLPFSFKVRRSSLELWPDGRSEVRAQAQADLQQRLADVERRRLKGAMNVVPINRRRP